LTEQMEGTLQVPDGQGAPGRQLAVDDDRGSDGLQVHCVLLLRRTRLHAAAVLRANEACNAHSLGVQMRPALECAGQLALIIHNLILEPEFGRSKALTYMEVDYYRTTIRATKGEIDHDQLLETLISVRRESQAYATRVMGNDHWCSESTDGRRGMSHKLRHIDKVAELVEGESWYRFLSNNFCHGNPAGVRDTWYGGVVSTNAIRDEVACAGMMDYLANQMAVMIAYAAMCPTDGQIDEDRVNNALAQLHAIRAKTKEHRDLAVSQAANSDMQGTTA